MHDICSEEMINKAAISLKGIFCPFGAIIPPFWGSADLGQNVVYAPTLGLHTIGSSTFFRQFFSFSGRKCSFSGSGYMRGMAKMGVKILSFQDISKARFKKNKFLIRQKKQKWISCKISPRIKRNV
jgi:hypothetical protein